MKRLKQRVNGSYFDKALSNLKKPFLNTFISFRAGFTLVEVMISAVIFCVAITGVFLAYGQAVRMLDALRQTSRSEDILLTNIEYLRTRTWAQLTNLVVTTTATTPSGWSSNMTESITSTNCPCTHLELQTNDVLKIGLKNASRDLTIVGYPNGGADTTSTDPMRKATVTLSWETLQGRSITNTMVTYITKGGMSAAIY